MAWLDTCLTPGRPWGPSPRPDTSKDAAEVRRKAYGALPCSAWCLNNLRLLFVFLPYNYFLSLQISPLLLPVL